MTLITALKCKDGIVMASDGQATGNSAGGPVRHEMTKIFKIGKNTLYGASGTIGMIQKSLEIVQEQSETFDDGITAKLRSSLRDRLLELSTEAQTIQKKYYGNSDGAPLADIIICTKDGSGEQRILHIGKDGNDEYLDSIGYACTGGGDVFGYTMLKNFEVKEFDVESAKLITYKIIRNAIEVGAYGLGYPIDIWSINSDGGVYRENEEDMKAIRDACLKLDEQEAKLIRQLSSTMRRAS